MGYITITLQHIIALLKNKFLLLFQIIGAFLLPIAPMILLLFFSIIIDTILGIYRAKKRKELITSNKMSNFVSKLLLYEVTLILFYCIDFYIINDIIHLFISVPYFLTKIIAIFLISIEVKSMNENIKLACGLNMFSLFKTFITRAKNVKQEIKDFHQ